LLAGGIVQSMASCIGRGAGIAFSPSGGIRKRQRVGGINTCY